ncbi:uncharacterized protein LOC106651837 [Trichogramma pretiosum]|uniref:uncharacterized protein LOC106651837 n=1 Tax=Trichogramma pretiosum TaxID=7493 RepID=UPI0006C9D6C1|nr:uncharacterized protein LOC106651837 [Trichogramma pretiosum]
MMIKKIFNGLLLGCTSNIFGLLAPLLIPPIHIGLIYYFWRDFSREVDRIYCTCSCWDTVFKGSYESGVASYKHMYFNATPQTLKMWVAVVLGVVISYETFKHLALLGFQRQIRWSMLILFISAVFSHYYSWWVYINYWNDDFYSQWYHQFFFSITELISTFFVIHLTNTKNSVTRRKALIIVSIAVLHILAGGWDQFYTNVLKGQGFAHQIVRDLGFMIPDILHVIIPIYLLEPKKTYSLPGAELRDTNLAKDLMYMFGIVFFGLVICSTL